MTYKPNIHHRRSIRLKGYDYSQAGAYFITICCQEKDVSTFGEIVDGKMILCNFEYLKKVVDGEMEKHPELLKDLEEAIKEAENRGCKIYDFWGFTDPEKFPKHPWAGPTLFKMGFGGYKEEYIKTQDFIISQKYWINYIIEIARKRKRNL